MIDEETEELTRILKIYLQSWPTILYIDDNNFDDY